MNIKEQIKNNKIKNFINKKEWTKLFDYLDNQKIFYSKIPNIESVIDSIIEEKKINLFHNVNFLHYYVYPKTNNEQLTFYDRITLSSTVEELEKNDFNDIMFYYSCFKRNKINDNLEKSLKDYLNHSNWNYNYNYNYNDITVGFHKYIKLLCDSEEYCDYYNRFGYLLKKEILKQFFTIDDLDLEKRNPWNDIILDFAKDDGDIFKFIKAFSSYNEITKLIDMLDEEIDCNDIENYDFILSFSKCNSSAITAKLLKKSNLSIEEQKSIIKNAPGNCNIITRTNR